MANHKRSKVVSPKQTKRMLAVVCCALLAVAAVISVFKIVGIKNKNETLEQKKQETKYTIDSFRLNIKGEINPKSVNIGDYISLQDFEEFYVADNSLMLEQMLELTYNSEMNYDYYIDNSCYSCKVDSEEGNFFFFGKDESYLPFYLKIDTKCTNCQWFVRADYVPPTVNTDKVEKILIIDGLTADKLPSNILENKDLPRLNTEKLLTVTDKKTVEDFVERYRNEVYVFTEKYDEIKEAKAKSMGGYVLAVFDSENVYQCIGTY